MSRNIFTALDVGSSTVQTVVAEKRKGDENLHLLGVGLVSSLGVRRGVVVDLEDATDSIRRSVEEAYRSAHIPIKSVWLSVGGAHVSVSSSRGVVAVSRADGEISPEDVRRAVAAAETFVSKNPNKEILHMIPRDFRVDHEPGIKNPVGMHGVRLEADTLIIECSAPFLKNLFKCVEGAGLRIEDYVFSPLAAAEAVLSKRQKDLGVILVDIGGGTASYVVYEEGVPIHAGVVPIGGGHITNDVAIGFRTQVDTAEQIKLAYGSCLVGEIGKKDVIRLAEFVEGGEEIYSKRQLSEIIQARVSDIFELLQKELRKINRTQLLPAGVIMVGGSSLLPGLVELARQEIKLPVEIGMPAGFADQAEERLLPSLATSLGMLKWAQERAGNSVTGWRGLAGSRMGQSGLVRWLKSLLP